MHGVMNPTLSLGGSPADRLTEQLADALKKARELADALEEARPDGRDYRHDADFYVAMRQHRERVGHVAQIVAELGVIYRSVVEQQEESERQRRWR
jgi:hypothetical protein